MKKSSHVVVDILTAILLLFLFTSMTVIASNSERFKAKMESFSVEEFALNE
jgi:hypothetical protein